MRSASSMSPAVSEPVGHGGEGLHLPRDGGSFSKIANASSSSSRASALAAPTEMRVGATSTADAGSQSGVTRQTGLFVGRPQSFVCARVPEPEPSLADQHQEFRSLLVSWLTGQVECFEGPLGRLDCFLVR